MKKNMGTIDRIGRILLALLLIVLYYNGTITGVIGLVLIGLAIIFVITSVVSVCPLYLPFGISTREKTNQKNAKQS